MIISLGDTSEFNQIIERLCNNGKKEKKNKK